MAEAPASSDAASAEFAKALFASLVRGTRLSNELPHDGHAYAFSPFAQSVTPQREQISSMMAGLIEQQATVAAAQRFAAMDDVADRFESVVDISDRLLERVDADLDLARGLSHARPDARGIGAAWSGGGGGGIGSSPMGACGGMQTPQRGTAALMPNSLLSAGSATRPQL
eukprot:1389577-Pleurochrysis_carterae.AAC.1